MADTQKKSDPVKKIVLHTESEEGEDIILLDDIDG